MDRNTISEGPTLAKIQYSLFLDYEKCDGNEGMVDFTIGGAKIGVIIEAAKRLRGGEWEIECFVPFADGWHFVARYSHKVRMGTILRNWQEKS